MQVVKRNGSRQRVSFEKIQHRIQQLAYGLSSDVDVAIVTQKVIAGVYDGVSTTELDTLSGETAASLLTLHPDYGVLAARIEVSNLHKNTEKDFGKVVNNMWNHVNGVTGEKSPMVSKQLRDIVLQHSEQLNEAIHHNRDYSYDYFGIKTLLRSYLCKMDGLVVERPQHMLMRVSLGIHGQDLDAAIETYDLMSQKMFTHATPTLFNAGTPKPQLSSCFLLQMKEDSVEGIMDTLKNCAVISKHAGGIGLAASKIRAEGSYVRGSNGSANGLIPMLRVFNDTARYVDQGGGKRKGSFNIYLEPWHADIFQFLSLKKNHGKEEERCRDLFSALWVPDLFMKRVEEDGIWSLMCPDTARGLHEVWGSEFEALYEKYEAEGKYKKQIKARDLWSMIVNAQTETGQPFMVYKDHCNRKSNQQHLGTIQSSNLCTEIVEYTSADEIAVCNLASISLPNFVDIESRKFDFEKLQKVTAVITRNLDKIIDINFYPLPECKNSNMRHRPIGIGIQGLADVFILLRVPFDSVEAKKLNIEIFECIYFAAVSTSNELAEIKGAYPSFKGSPASKGLLQFDLWEHKPSGKYPWKELKENIKTHGLRNSLLTAPMPTASTSQILGNNECFEPYTSNVYVRRTLAGEFVVINKHLLRDLISLGLWNEDLKQKLIANNGSVQNLFEIPGDLRKLYRTVWEIKQREIINMAADRGPFIDQSQSMNIHLRDPNYAKMTSMHFYGWKKGLKTGMYYLRTKAAVDATKVTVPTIQMAVVKERKALKQDVVMKSPGTVNVVRRTVEVEDKAEEVEGSCQVDDVKSREKTPEKFNPVDVQMMLNVIAKREKARTAVTAKGVYSMQRKKGKRKVVRHFDDDEKDDDYKAMDEVADHDRMEVVPEAPMTVQRQEDDCLMCGS